MNGPRDLDRVPVYSALSTFVLERRKAKGLNRVELARRMGAGFTKDSIKVIETGMHKSAPRRTMEALCRCLDIDELPADRPFKLDLWWKGPETLTTLSKTRRNFIRDRRQKMGLTQADMARATGLCGTTYRLIEGDPNTRVNTRTMARVLSVLQVRPSLNLGKWAVHRGLTYVGPTRKSCGAKPQPPAELPRGSSWV